MCAVVVVVGMGSAAAAVDVDSDLYFVLSDVVTHDVVRRYDGTTGVFIEEMGTFHNSGSGRGDPTFGPDGNLYMQLGSKINKFDMTTRMESTFVEAANVSSSPSGFAFGPVPEPATLSLLTLGGLAMLRRRRK
jgi:hypothetical protein